MTDAEGAKDRVLQRLESDLSSAEMQWSLFMSALESYRHDSILRPFPSAYVEDGGNKNFQRLVSVYEGKPVKAIPLLNVQPPPPPPPPLIPIDKVI